MKLVTTISAVAILLLANLAQAATIAASGDPGDTPGDLFDVSTGATVTATSPVLTAPSAASVASTSDASDLIGGDHGGNGGNIEGAGRILFGDHQGSTDTVTFTTPTPVTLNKFDLWLSEDSPASINRSATFFSLTVDGNVVDTVPIVASGTSYNTAYGSDFIEVSDTFAVVTGSTFVATFGVNSDGTGPRVYELDAFLTPEPTPLVALVGLGAMGLFVVARRRRKMQSPNAVRGI